MIRTKVYPAIDADFSLKYIKNRIETKSIVIAKPTFFQTKTEENSDNDNLFPSDLEIIQKQWNELKGIYHWLKDKGFLAEIHEIDSTQNTPSLTLIAEKFFSWNTENGKKYFLLNTNKHIDEKEDAEVVRSFFNTKNSVEINYEKKEPFAGTLDFVPHINKNMIFAGVKTDSKMFIHKYVTHIFQTPIIALELMDSRFKHLSECFLQIDSENALYYSKAFSNETKEYLNRTYKHIIDLPEEEVLNYALSADLYSNKSGSIALMKAENSLTSKLLKKFGYKVIDVDLSEFNKFGAGIKHLRNKIH